MLKAHLSYNPPISWWILFRYGVRSRQVIHLKKFRAMVVSGGGFCEGKTIQVIMTTTVVLPNVQSYLRRKGDATGASVHAPRHRNSTYVQMFRQYL